MRRAVFAHLAALVVAGPAWALPPGVEQVLLGGGPPVAYVKSATSTDSALSAVTSRTAAFASPVAQGNAVVVFYGVNTSTLDSVVDDKGNSYTVVPGTCVVAPYNCWVAYNLRVSGGPTTVTATTASAGTFARIAADEFSGVRRIVGSDYETSASNVTSLSTIPLSITAGGMLWTGGITGTPVAPAGFTSASFITPNMRTAYKPISASGTLTVTWSWTSAAGLIAALSLR